MDSSIANTSSQPKPSISLSGTKNQIKLSYDEAKPFDFWRFVYDGVIAGGTAGVVVEAALYPIDTIKTRLQAVHGGGKIMLRGLYSGLAGNLAGVLPASAIFVGVYEPTKQKLLQMFPENLSALAHLEAKLPGDRLLTSESSQLIPSLLPEFHVTHEGGHSGAFQTYKRVDTSLLDCDESCVSICGRLRSANTAGALGGAASSLVRVPTEVVKQRMQTGQFTSAPDAVRLIVAREGFKGLYAGYTSFLLRDLPFDAIQFCIYEQLRIGYRLAARRDLKDHENALIGAFAGAITGAVTTPLDVIKTRLMVQGSTNQYKGIISCVKTIVGEEGTHALMKGVGPRVLWIGIGGSIFFGVLERTKQILSDRRLESQ